jgi:preprotein translocase subunit SecD
MAVLSRFKSFGTSRFSGLGSVDVGRAPQRTGRAADRVLVGAGTSGSPAAGTRNRSDR